MITNAIEAQSKENNVSLWCSDGNEKEATANTSLLVEVSKEEWHGKGNWRLPEEFLFSNWA